MVKSNATANNLSDGAIRFTVKDLDGNAVRTLAIDALILKLCCEEAEAANGYKAGTVPASSFLVDLAKRMQTIGVEDCSPSVAYQLWHLAGQAISDLKKNTSETPNLPSGSTRRRAGKGRAGR